MSFGLLSPLAVALGLAGLGAALYLLQRLRVRHREVVVPTMLFWKQALDEQRARVFVRRFRHPLAFACICLLAGALWILGADPQKDRSKDARVVYLVDGSALAAKPGVLADVRRRLAETLEADGADVFWCGARPRLLLESGETPRLLDERWPRAGAENTPRTIEATLLDLAKNARGRVLDVTVVSPFPADAAATALLPANVRVGFLSAWGRLGLDNGRGVVALGIAEAASGAYVSVDLLVAVRCEGGAPPTDLSLALDGKALAVPEFGRVGAAGVEWQTVVRDVPAQGGEVVARFASGDGLDRDDQATLVLPRREPIAVGIEAAIDAFVRPVLEADPAIKIVASGGDVRITAGSRAEAPTLAFTSERPGDADFLVLAPDEPNVDPLARIFAGIDRESIARLPTAETSKPLPVVARRTVEAGPRTVLVARDLLGDGSSFTRVDAFPVFLAQAVRFLAAVPTLVPSARVGQALGDRTGPLVDGRGESVMAAGEPVRALEAGRLIEANGAVHVASLLDRRTSAGVSGDAAVDSKRGAERRGGLDWSLVVGVLVFAGLLFEWWFVRKGRMP